MTNSAQKGNNAVIAGFYILYRALLLVYKYILTAVIVTIAFNNNS